MQTNQLSVHVATTTHRVGDKVYHSHLLRHSFRENGKVKNVTVANLSMLPESVIDVIRVALKGQAVVPAEHAFESICQATSETDPLATRNLTPLPKGERHGVGEGGSWASGTGEVP